MKKIAIYILCLFFAGLITACIEGETRIAPTILPVSSSTPTITPIPKTATPTPRTFMYDEAIDCANSEVPGHLFFLLYNPSDDREYTSRYDLYVSDGNGCSSRFVMERVSGSPVWSKDGKYLAIGCENNEYLCMLDVKATLDTCTGSVTETGECIPVVHSKYILPSIIVFLHNMWWSPDGTQIIVEGSDNQSGGRATWYFYSLNLQSNGEWNPISQELTCPGLFFPDNDLTDKLQIADGYCPEWSSDGSKIAYVSYSEDQSKETFGIKIFDLEAGTFELAYEPANKDHYYWPPQNIYVGEETGDHHKLLSWSPDNRFIAFMVGGLLGFDDQQILRLDLETDEIVRLTTGLIKQRGAYHRYLAPAWGP